MPSPRRVIELADHTPKASKRPPTAAPARADGRAPWRAGGRRWAAMRGLLPACRERISDKGFSCCNRRRLQAISVR